MKTKEGKAENIGDIFVVMEYHHIDFIGGCSHCQPNGDWADGWGSIPDEVRDCLTDEDSCCEEINEDGRTTKNFPTFCKFEEVSE